MIRTKTIAAVGVLLGIQIELWAGTVLLKPDPLNSRWLSVPDATKTALRSGFDYKDGNYDSGNLVRVEPEGALFTNSSSAWVVFEAAGPGVITSTWLTGKSKKGEAYIGGILNFHFDGEAIPRISGSLPQLFEDGKLFPKALAEKSSGGWVCFAPIYFDKSLKITVTGHNDSYGHRKNGREEMIPHIYHQFSYQKLDGAAASSGLNDPRWKEWARDETGNSGRREYQISDGRAVRVFEASGKGILKNLRIRWQEGDPDAAKLKVVADGTTRVEMGVAEFWGFSRKGRPEAKFQSLLAGVDDAGVYYCAFPMPHRERLAVELSSSAPQCKVEVETIQSDRWVEPEHLYFHAERVNTRSEPGVDVKLLERKGRGHFVGMIMELVDGTLEGDDRFYVDGEPFPPAWHGTGTEDYFRCGWYFHGGPLSRPLYGLLDAARPKIAYRFHMADRINFTRSVVIGFEHGHANKFVGPFRGVVFWYGD